ncbi:hypothetical protein AJ79_00613 [Helicocarpus griseus UAMH5409]|uniref:Ras modification protein ERF4 n=1 Tax=Helicocarpus griseus UAMH5409 TaxID=1447875 RepID=A0A2B7Y2G6_9EURO|nr:hypothetical protein AJ79_00613 [Helicocarpus griseus UAMH5409]
MPLLVAKAAPKPLSRSPITAAEPLQFLPRPQHKQHQHPTQQPRRPTPFPVHAIYHRGRLKTPSTLISPSSPSSQTLPPLHPPPFNLLNPRTNRFPEDLQIPPTNAAVPRDALSSHPFAPVSASPPHPGSGTLSTTFPATPSDGYPLLTIPEQRRSRQQPSPTSLLVERSVADTESGRASIGLPPSHRRSGVWENMNLGNDTVISGGRQRNEDNIRRPDAALLRPNGLFLGETNKSNHPDDHPDVPRHVPSQNSLRSQTLATYPSGNGNHSSGGGGADGDVAEELAWGPSHPCFPHMNPHVPVSSPEYHNTRIIRIRRDWMVKGDLAPTFSNLYPEILDPLLPEHEFRTVIAKINNELIAAFDPYSPRNWIDGAIGLVTGWVWDDVGANGIKGRLKSVEQWLENWNATVGLKEGVKIWSLRSTGYMSVDIEIPDPKVGIVESEAASAPGTRPDTGRNTDQLYLRSDG